MNLPECIQGKYFSTACILLLFAQFLFLKVSGQLDSLPPSSTQSLQFRFIRQNNFTFLSSEDLSYSGKWKRFEFSIVQHHDNIFNSARKDDPFVQLYFSNSVWFGFPGTSKVKAVTWFESDHFVNTQNEKIQLYGGVSIKKIKGLEAIPLIGYSWDKRNNILNTGITPALLLHYNKTLQGNLFVRADAFLRTKYIDPRFQKNMSLIMSLGKSIGKQVYLSLDGVGGLHELDDFISNSVQKIYSDTVSIRGNLRYGINKYWTFESLGMFSYKKRKFEYKPLYQELPEFNTLYFEQSDFITEQKLTFSRKKLYLLGAYETNIINRFYTLENTLGINDYLFKQSEDREKEKDYFSVYQKIRAFGSVNLNAKHIISSEYFSQYMKYDTPSELNFDDRDELTHVGNISHKAEWTKQIRSILEMTANYRYFGFLYEQKSKDNYRQWNLKYRFFFEWELFPDLKLKADQQVYVTYNIKVFGDPLQTDRSTRNLETNYALQKIWLKKYLTTMSIDHKVLHLSYLNWDKFSETTLDSTYFTTIKFEQKMPLSKNSKNWQTNVLAGYKYFSQVKHQNSGMYTLDNVYQNINLRNYNIQNGPYCSLFLNSKKNSSLMMNIWFQTQIVKFKYRNTGGQFVPAVPYKEEDLMKSSKVFRPFVECLLNFSL